MPAPKGNDYAKGHGMGRPTEYRPEFSDMVENHMAKGYSFESFAGYLGVCKKTIYNWRDQHEDFLHAVTRAKEKCRLWWEGIMLEHLVHTQRGKRIDPKLWEFNMKNRFGEEWKDKTEQKIDQKVDADVRSESKKVWKVTLDLKGGNAK